MHVYGSGQYVHAGTSVEGWLTRGIGGYCDGLGLAHPTHWMPMNPPQHIDCNQQGQVQPICCEAFFEWLKDSPYSFFNDRDEFVSTYAVQAEYTTTTEEANDG